MAAVGPAASRAARAQHKRGCSALLRGAAGGLLAAVTVVLLAALSQLSAWSGLGSRPSDALVVTAAVEAVKVLLASVGLVLRAAADVQGPRHTLAAACALPPRYAAALLIPAVMFAANNNLYHVAVRYVSPAAFTVVSNLKLPATGVASYLLLRRPPSRRQWAALALLTVGCMLVDADKHVAALFGEASAGVSSRSSHSLMGLLLTTVYCCGSALANVATEKVQKRSAALDVPSQATNVVLYSFGAAVNCAAAVATGVDVHPAAVWAVLQAPWVGSVVLVASVLGLLISEVCRRWSTLVKVYLGAGASVLSACISLAMGGDDGYSPGLLFAVAVVVVALSARMYFTSPGAEAKLHRA